MFIASLDELQHYFDRGCDRGRSGHFIFDKNRELAQVRNQKQVSK